MENFIKKGFVPHLVLSGSLCKDKTLIAKLFAKEFCEKNGGSYHIIFADDRFTSDRSSSSVFIENIIEPLVENRDLQGSLRLVIINDFDMRNVEQNAFRRIMENYSHCRMIFIVETINSIIEPILSRSFILYFRFLTEREIESSLNDIIFSMGFHSQIQKNVIPYLKNYSLLESLLFSFVSMKKYKTISSFSYKKIIRNKKNIDTIIREISLLRFQSALMELHRIINNFSWREFAKQFAEKIILSSYKYKYESILLLSRMDEEYNGENVEYYATYFLLRLKEGLFDES